MRQSGFELPTETNLREAWVRAMKDSRAADGSGGLLPSHAAQLVAAMFNVSPLVVLLAVGSSGRQAVGDTR